MNKNTLIGILGVILVMWGIHYFLIDNQYVIPDSSSSSKNQGNSEEYYSNDFERITPKPSWWDNVREDNVTITNYDELISYWQSEKRCCSEEEIKDTNRKFYKTTYLAILNNPDNADIIVNGINMMDLSYIGVNDFTQAQLYALETFPDYKKPLHNCANCKEGDVVASLLEEIGAGMRRKNQQQEFIDLAMKFLEKRGPDMSEYYEAKVFLQTAYAYEDLGQNDMAMNTIRFMFDRYKNAPETGALKSTMASAERLLKKLREL